MYIDKENSHIKEGRTAMEIRKITVNGKEYEFVNQSRDTRSGFAHDTTLFVNGYEEVNESCHYLNRTWECYRYQTVMLKAVDTLENWQIDRLTKNFKTEKGYTKLTPKRKEELNLILAADQTLNEYKEVKEKLKNSWC